MMKPFLLPALAIAGLAGSAKAEDPSTATAWICTSQTSERAEYVMNGNELKKRDDDLDRYEACRRNHLAPTSGPGTKISAEAFPADPCESPDLESYTFKIELNNSNVIVAVSPTGGGDTWVAKRMIILDKITGSYTETLLSTPTLSRHIAGNEYGGTCDAKSLGNPKSVSSVSDVSQSPVPAVAEEKKPQRKSDTRMVEEEKPQQKTETRETHVHAHRHHRHGHRHKH